MGYIRGVKKGFVARVCAFLFLIHFNFLFADNSPIKSTSKTTVRILWNKFIRNSNTSASLQVVVNPLIRRESAIHSRVFDNLKELHADNIRFVPWMPYPRLAVAELKAPTATETFWDFSKIDPIFDDFYKALEGKNFIFNFSTAPQWLFETSWEVWYPDNPNEEYWSYQHGTELRDRSLTELKNYYERLYRWYAKGEFIDEIGQRHVSGHSYKIPIWEVFNEPESEHLTTPEQYNQRYDAIVSTLHPLDPKMKFMGPALMRPAEQLKFIETFLDPKKHQSNIPIDWLSYHFYAETSATAPLEIQQNDFFTQSDDFINTVNKIEEIRKQLSPATKTSINEVGTMFREDHAKNFYPIDNTYWQLSGAVFAYLYGNLSTLGIEMISESQLVAFPGQFPSVSMVDWTTGEGNARYWVLKLILENIKLGDQLYSVQIDNPDVYALAFKSGKIKKILLVNKKNTTTEVRIENMKSAFMESVSSHQNGIHQSLLTDSKFELSPWSVAVLIL